MAKSLLSEELQVLFHAALLGRSDIIKNAIASYRSTGKSSPEDIAHFVSTIRPEDGATPLHVAAHGNHSDAIRTLLNAGARLDIIATEGIFQGKLPYELSSDATKQTTFHVYLFEQIAIGNVPPIVRLLKGGVPVGIVDGSKLADSPLHWACSFGNDDVAAELLAWGCDPNIMNSDLQTPLHLACKGSHLKIALILLNEGGDVTLTDKAGKLPADYISPAGEPLRVAVNAPPIQPSRPYHSLYMDRLATQEVKVDNNGPIVEEGIEEEVMLSPSPESSDLTPPPPPPQQDEEEIEDEKIPKKDLFSVLYGRSIGGGGEEGDAPLPGSINKPPTYIFWPPLRQQQCHPNLSPLKLSSAENTLICISSAEVDIFPLLLSSGLIEVMDNFGLQVQVKRSAAGARISICVDSNICPHKHSYNIQVRSDMTVLAAADSTGLLYGVYTFMQLLQLHSEVTTSVADSAAEGPTTTTVLVPALDIKDWPTVSNRALLWSHRQHCRMNISRWPLYLELFSKLHFNMLLLVMDTTTTQVRALPDQDKVDEQLSAEVFTIDEEARRKCIAVIPTHTITSIHQRLSVELLRNFSHNMVGISLLLSEESVTSEIDSDVSAAELCGFTTVLLGCSPWVSATVNPRLVAISVGLNVVEKGLDILLPADLAVKPIIASQTFLHAIHTYAKKVADDGSFISVLPAFMDAEFMCPALVTKFYSFIFAGYCWNPDVCGDILGSPCTGYFDNKLIREVLSLVLWRGSKLNPSLTDRLKGVLATLTGDTLFAELGLGSSERPFTLTQELSLALKENDSSILPDVVPERDQTTLCLKLYRRLLQSSNWKPSSIVHTYIHTPSDTTTGQHSNGTSNGSAAATTAPHTYTDNSKLTISSEVFVVQLQQEVDEFFATVNMISMVCKAIIQSQNSHQKQIKATANNVSNEVAAGSGYASFATLITGLSIGTKSDLANNVLEALATCSVTWSLRFHGVHHHFHSLGSRAFFRSNADVSNENAMYVWDRVLKNIKESEQSSGVDLAEQVLQLNAIRSFLVSAPYIPGSAILKSLTEKLLPLPSSVEQFISRLFLL